MNSTRRPKFQKTTTTTPGPSLAQNTTTSLENYEDTTSVVQLAELVLVGVCVGLIIICTIFYIITRVMRRKHQKQFRQMEVEARDPLKESTQKDNNHT